MKYISPLLLAFTLLAVLNLGFNLGFAQLGPLQSGTAPVWDQTSFQSLTKGTPDGVSLGSTGTLRLAPRFDLIQEIDSTDVWATVEDSLGNLYIAGGSPGRVYKIPPSGKPSVFFESHEEDVSALAVDRQGRIYAATMPDGAIYRIEPDGKSSPFFNPKAKYIWAMGFDSKDNLFVATGDKGQIWRVSPSGQGILFIATGEAHIRSLIVAEDDNVFAGTDGSGLILLIQPDTTAFVLYQSPKKNITSLTFGSNGILYAAAAGDKVPRLPPFPGQPAIAGVQPVPQPPTPLPSLLMGNLTGGSELYRITPDGYTKKFWSSGDTVYSLALGPAGKLLAGTGNDGKIYQMENGGNFSLLAHAPSSQITKIVPGHQQVLFAASNTGALYRLHAELVKQGTFVSDIFDAGKISVWGRVESKQELPPGTAIRIETRSGNNSNPLLNWSRWKDVRADGSEAVSQSPRARFFQWRAVLSSKNAEVSPTLSSIQFAYGPPSE